MPKYHYISINYIQEKRKRELGIDKERNQQEISNPIPALVLGFTKE
jgi:hypothetical protein